MASTYALPASAMAHSHHAHAHTHGHHSHSHSHSPNPAGGPEKLHTLQYLPSQRREINGHSHTHSQPYSPGQDHSHVHAHGHTSDHHDHHDHHDPHVHHDHNMNAGHTHTLSCNGRGEIKNGNLFSPTLSNFSSYEPIGGIVTADGAAGAALREKSRFTAFLLPYCEGIPLLHTILIEKDSRRIFYFMGLNLAFMLIQAFYGFVTDSLGLLSDSIHMFFDCLALAMGLFAAVASKWPASERFPYGFSKIESLSGFGNGVFLMLISIEIVIEAVDRLADGRETKRLLELFIVSSLGLIVNLVGMACFGHHHHGHDHSHGGHSHDHSHDHVHSHSPSHSHDEKHSHDHSHAPSPATPLTVSHEHSHHHHDHDNENMRGLFLHVLADTMGSAAVIVSTILMYFLNWPGWDPLASCVIAVLIFASSVPLVISSARKLLLTLPADTEYQLRNTLAGVSGLRGVASYSVPKFWIGENDDKGVVVLGVIHVIATKQADLEDVRERTRDFLSENGMDVVVQVDREGTGRCWCTGDAARSPVSSRF